MRDDTLMEKRKAEVVAMWKQPPTMAELIERDFRDRTPKNNRAARRRQKFGKKRK